MGKATWRSTELCPLGYTAELGTGSILFPFTDMPRLDKINNSHHIVVKNKVKFTTCLERESFTRLPATQEPQYRSRRTPNKVWFWVWGAGMTIRRTQSPCHSMFSWSLELFAFKFHLFTCVCICGVCFACVCISGVRVHMCVSMLEKARSDFLLRC